jgi:hypothetical protein
LRDQLFPNSLPRLTVSSHLMHEEGVAPRLPPPFLTRNIQTSDPLSETQVLHRCHHSKNTNTVYCIIRTIVAGLASSIDINLSREVYLQKGKCSTV